MQISALQDTLVKALAIEEYPKEAQDKIIGQLAEVISQRAVADLAAALPEEKRKTFALLIKAEDDVQTEAFLRKEVPRFQEITMKSMEAEVQAFLDAKARGFRD